MGSEKPGQRRKGGQVVQDKRSGCVLSKMPAIALTGRAPVCFTWLGFGHTSGGEVPKRILPARCVASF